MAHYWIDYLQEVDLDAVQAIDAMSFSTPWSRATYLQELRSPQHHRSVGARFSAQPAVPPAQTVSTLRNRLRTLLRPQPVVPRSAGSLIGHGGIMRTAGVGHITTLAVAPHHRGHGIGALLLLGLIEQAYDLQVRRVELEVRVSNIHAQRLYTTFGFTCVARIPDYYPDNGEDADVMCIPDISTIAFRELLKARSDALYLRLQHDKAPVPQVPAPDQAES